MQNKRWFPRAGALRTPLRILYWAPLGIVLTTHWYNVRVISGPSMQPTLNPEWSLSKDYAVFDKVAVLDKQDCHRGDIITLKSPLDPKYKLIKRIVAEEGDTVKTLPPYPLKEVKIPQGYVWVEGDDPFNSDDSNMFGPVPRALIESKLVFLIWPPSRVGKLEEPKLPLSGTGPTFRRAMAAFERAHARQSRVTPAAKIVIPERV
ncbi:peptidase S24/S26A/S26B/S26C [Ephemerocybe angulata]|uniref:Mitochondrial inner membrane protease subunit 2 n=1 Tax=Ephemerocybe angulata TaxID=980116 RepID=A0A8H6IC37_9AGAR|nr:peptidase S24/S26A/S26B/S26C [Tulosesus angulatus]